MKNARPTEVKASALDKRTKNTTQDTILEQLRADLLAGRAVRIIDVPREQRPETIAALALLRDELPVKVTWRTYSESHVCETRLRCKCYWIAPEHLHDLLSGGVQ